MKLGVKEVKSINCTYIALILTVVSGDSTAEAEWGVGLGGMAFQQGYIDVGNQISAIPIISYKSKKLRINGSKFGYKLAKHKGADFSFIGQYRFDGYKASDGDIFQGMVTRSNAFELGIALAYRSKLGGLSLKLLTDASSNHQGHELSLTYAALYRLGSLKLTPYASLTGYSENFVDYYYGVGGDEALDFRPSYSGQATINTLVGLKAKWHVGKQHHFILNASYMTFGHGIEQSPLVDKSGSGKLTLGYIYAF